MPPKYSCYVCSKNCLDHCIFCEVCHLVIYSYTPRRIEHIVAASSVRPSVRPKPLLHNPCIKLDKTSLYELLSILRRCCIPCFFNVALCHGNRGYNAISTNILFILATFIFCLRSYCLEQF